MSIYIYVYNGKLIHGFARPHWIGLVAIQDDRFVVMLHDKFMWVDFWKY